MNESSVNAYRDGLMAVIVAEQASEKAALLAQLHPVTGTWEMPALPARPGRPAHWREVTKPPRRHRTLAHEPTRNHFLLAIHHIELSAIDLAVVACMRGSDMPLAFHHDFLGIARDEARHAGLLETLLAARGIFPGDDPIHHRLWEATVTCADLGDHLVAIPRFLEARGLDVSAELLPRLREMDPAAHEVLSVIYHDEITHVDIGTRWHRVWCDLQPCDALEHFQRVVRRLFPGQVPGPTPLDAAGRQTAGFVDDELAWLRKGDVFKHG